MAGTESAPGGAHAPTPEGIPLVDRGLVKSWFLGTLVWMVIAPVLGLIASVKLDDPNFLWGIEWLQFGRLRIAHVNGVVFGLFTTACFGFMCYAVPKLCGRPLANRRMAWWGMGLFQVCVLAGECCLLAGKLQPVEAGEYPLIIDLIAVVAYIMIVIPFFVTIARRRHEHMYVSLWYWVAGMLWTAINLPLGSLILPNMSGVTSAATHGFYLHNVVGLWITPMGLGVAYYMLPTTTRARLYSHKLSLIGFWTLAFFYPMNGIHHYIYSPIADWSQTIAIAASLMLMLPVFAFTANVWMTMRGQWQQFTADNYVLKLTVLAALWYLITCVQGPTEAFRDMQALTHFGDYNVGHAHSAVYGAFAIWMMAATYYCLTRVAGRKLWSLRLASWHYWLQIVGFSLMFIVLCTAGFVQGEMQQRNDTAFIDTVAAIRPFWVARTVGGSLMDVGIALFFYNVVMTLCYGKRVPLDSGEDVTHAPALEGGAV